MQKLTHKLTLTAVLCTALVQAQLAPGVLEDVGLFLDDARLYADQYITPATDAAVYQASSQWMYTPKKKRLGEVHLGFHANAFVVPSRDRSFVFNNDDYHLLQLRDEAGPVHVPSALGGKQLTYLSASLGGSDFDIRVPEGVNMESIVYPYLQGSVGLWGGTELIGRYSTKVRLKRGYYQVFGMGVQHNLTQHFSFLKNNEINVAVMMGYSNEDISFNFLSLNTPFGDLGLSSLRGLVDTYHIQIGASKSYQRWEFMGSVVGNKSWFVYRAGGNPTDEVGRFFNELVNIKLREITKSKVNFMGELSTRYTWSQFTWQTALMFGKFVNVNTSIQYQFDLKSKS